MSVSKQQFITLRKEINTLSYDIAESLSTQADKIVRLDTIFNKSKLSATQRKDAEIDVVLGRVRYYLKKVSNRIVSIEDSYSLWRTKEKTKVEEAAFTAARSYKSWIFRKANISPVDARGGSTKGTTKGRPEGSTNNTKTVAFTAKAGDTLTPKVASAESLNKFVRGEAARLYAFYEKNKDVTGCDQAMQAILTFYKTITLIK